MSQPHSHPRLGMSVSSRARWTRPIDGRGWKAAHKPGSVHRRRARGPGGGGDHLSGTAVTGGLERLWGYGTGRWPTVVPRAEALALLLAGVYRAGTSRCRWCALTAPLHPYLCWPADRSPQAAIGGVFLWHCPHGRPHRALPGRPGHRGARTFLNRPDRSWVETRQRSTDRDHLGCFPGNRLSSRPPAGCPPAREPCWRPGHRWR